MSVYDVAISSLDGGASPLAALAGKTTLIVNVASRCGLTPQYSALEALQRERSGAGFSVLGVPCNQFMGQEPGSPEEIAAFCSTTYGVTFPFTEKVEVNGDARHPLYDVLTASADDKGRTGDIQWNFEKFLVGKSGDVIARFGPRVAPDDPAVLAAIDAALA